MPTRPEDRLKRAVSNVVRVAEARKEAAKAAEAERRKREAEAARER